MNEINKPEQQLDSSEIQSSPAELREARDRGKEMGHQLDHLRPEQEQFGARAEDRTHQKILENEAQSPAERLDNLKSPSEVNEGDMRGLTEEERSKVNDIVAPHYDKAREVTENATKGGIEGGERDYKGANFTDHNEAHVQQVEVKTTETLDACVGAIKDNKLESADAKGDVHFSADVDYKVTQAAALSHDTGMSNDLYHCDKETGSVEKQNGRDFDSVRNNHCANSALNVLANREQYNEAGFSNEQVDDIAMLTFSHSKSNSGIEDLNNSADWEKGAYRLDAYVTAYNTDHPDSQISFNRDQFSDKEKLGVLATESLSLRVGDVSRDSGPDAPAQCGEPVHVEKNLNCDISKATCWKEEVAGFDVTVGDRKLDCNDKDDLKSIRVHAGEQNIAENHTAFDGNRLVHTISVYDGDHAPYCTQEAVKDHVGELASAKNGDFVVDLSFDTACSKTAEGKYEEFRDSLYKKDEYGNNPYENVQLKFPWDKE